VPENLLRLENINIFASSTEQVFQLGLETDLL